MNENSRIVFYRFSFFKALQKTSPDIYFSTPGIGGRDNHRSPFETKSDDDEAFSFCILLKLSGGDRPTLTNPVKFSLLTSVMSAVTVVFGTKLGKWANHHELVLLY